MSQLLVMNDIGKSFAGVNVLSGVSFDLHEAEVHVLAGENGAGKSTLIKILAGVYDDFEGSIRVRGKDTRFRSPHDALRSGISVIYQEMSLVGSMSIADNIFLGRELGRSGLHVDARTQHARAVEGLREFGVEVDPGRTVESCPVPVRQVVEIVRALMFDARIIVMDEPTSALSAPETERLFGIIARLKERGCGVVYISHKMEEVYRIADRITILRDGERVATVPAQDLPRQELIRLMVGREVHQQFPRRPPPSSDLLLEVRNFSLTDTAGRMVFGDVSFDVHRGEIVGIAGLQGAGNSELLNALFGVYGKAATGTVRMLGTPIDVASPLRGLHNGLALLTNDRKGTGLIPDMNIRENVTLAALPRFSPAGFIHIPAESQALLRQTEQLRMRYARASQRVAELSGGNQQKVVLAKWLETGPKILLLDEPTRGVDVGVKHEIYELMNRWTSEGCGIVLITSEMPELLAMADRIVVMSRGKITSTFDREQATQETVLHAAMGGGDDNEE